MILSKALSSSNFRFIHILSEVRFRFLWCLFSYTITFSFCFFFSEELLYLLAKPFLLLSHPAPLTSSFDFHNECVIVSSVKTEKSSIPPFLSTQLTEALNTYVISSFLFSFVFCIPFFVYQVWCFLIPSYNETQRLQASQFLFLSFGFFVFFLSISFFLLLPTIWLFLYQLNNTSTNLFVIQLQPKIYDFIMLTIRFLCLCSIGSQIPVLVLWLVQLKTILLQDCVKYRSSLVFFCILLSSLLTPPDLFCQLLTTFFMLIIIELTFFYAFVQNCYSSKKCGLTALPGNSTR